MLAIANAADRVSRADAARAAGMDRQTLRDWAVRCGAEGIAGLHDRPEGHPAPRLTEGELAALANVIFYGPDPEKDGIST
ncbi:helix-turn-helix domain-containing protein [Aureimonas sp. SA4125]|uniref:helix-turn-helix domain-containing protein n=1 Tax=Aureimonas sp. SA4125 TaxID=2826993 RepID=UPI001CC3935D|nr:helix-turn-helix domain-containing protein [Aureimonas sp. SA4125]